MELHLKQRPRKLDQVIGQVRAVKTIKNLHSNNRLPHCTLLYGPSGCGKTTLARIVMSLVNCHKTDTTEINCAGDRGIDLARTIERKVRMKPIAGESRGWILDEAHKLTNDAQNMLLKIFEETPSWAYFVLASTDHQKILPTVRTRCTEIKVEALSKDDLKLIVQNACDKNKLKVKASVIDRIAEVSDGCGRKALVLLQQVGDFETEKEQLEAVQKADTKRQAIEIARALLDTRTDWTKMRGILQGVTEDPETIRYMVLGYMSKVLLNSSNLRAYQVIKSFRRNFYDGKGADLIGSCYELICFKPK